MQHSRRRFGCLFVAGDFSLENLEIVLHSRILVLECSLTPEIPALKDGFFFRFFCFFFFSSRIFFFFSRNSSMGSDLQHVGKTLIVEMFLCYSVFSLLSHP